MPDQPRYAIFYTPRPDSALWRFGSRVLGYDAADPSTVPPPFADFDPARGAGVFSEPSRYGFHATLKAPFELAAGQSEMALLDAAAAFAARTRAVPMGRLRIALLDRFVALMPANAPPEVNDIAGECVRAFEPFRAPLSEADRERRLKGALTEAEIAYLDRWGYPYVFERFLFHMTLAGPLPVDFMGPLHQTLSELYDPIDRDIVLDGIAVFRQPARTERAAVLRRFALAN